ncbi:hypothetical protein INR49_004782 [Caranx melampygus]|nr:hypothetical protein INR49_004782 [Caranx melampygus]
MSNFGHFELHNTTRSSGAVEGAQLARWLWAPDTSCRLLCRKSHQVLGISRSFPPPLVPHCSPLNRHWVGLTPAVPPRALHRARFTDLCSSSVAPGRRG